MMEENARRNGSHPKLGGWRKVSQIVSNNIFRLSGNGKFQNQIFIRVGQARTPAIINVLVPGQTGEVAQQIANLVRSASAREMLGSRENGLPFQVKRERKGQLEMRSGQSLQNGVTRAVL
jgi:hypothetical protein